MTSDTQQPTTRAVISAVFLATLIGAFVRVIHVGAADFPLNDGGLFFTMTRDLVANGFAIPVATSYNGADIPFLYPPLGFYLAGLLSLAGLDLFSVFRFMPLAISILTIPAVYLFASRALPSRFAAVIAAIAYAVVPRSFEWIIAGGGVTRGLGVLFAILVLWAAIRLERQPDRGRCVALGALAGLAALSHPTAVIAAGFWLLVLLATSHNRSRTLRWLLGSGVVALVVVLPWLVSVLPTHGLAGFIGAGQTGLDPDVAFSYLLGFDFTNETHVTVVAALSIIGIALRARSGDWRWLLWVAVVAIDPRSGTSFVMPIVAAAAAIAITEVVLPAFAVRAPPSSMVWPDASLGRAPRVLLAVFLALGISGAVDAPGDPLSPLFALGPNTRAAIVEVGNETPADAEVVVIGGTQWWVDATTEWFPVLAGRRSVATVQGNEWLDAMRWRLAVDRHVGLQICAFESPDCFETWRARYAHEAGYVFMPRDVPGFSPIRSECCLGLRSALIVAGYPVVLDMPGGTLLAIP